LERRALALAIQLGPVRAFKRCEQEHKWIYADYLTTAERQRSILDLDVAWNEIDRGLALSQPDLLDQMRNSARIESYFPVYTDKLIRWSSQLTGSLATCPAG
jgi:hypothetical protein